MTDKYDGAIEKLINYIDNTIVFAKEQMPEVAMEILNYGVVFNTYIAILCGIFVGIFLLMFLMSWMKYEGELTFFSGIALIIFTAFFLASILHLKKIELAPKLYVLQEIRSLTK